MPARTDHPVFVLRLLPLSGVDGVRALRAALKVLLRRFGLKALSIEVEPANPRGGEDGGREAKPEVQGSQR
jgi:hypothetical protein